MDALFRFLETNPGYFAGVAILAALFIIWQMARLFAPTFAKTSEGTNKANDVSHDLTTLLGQNMVNQQAILDSFRQVQEKQIELLAKMNNRHESNTGKLDLVSEGIKKILEQDTVKYSTLDLTLTTVMNMNTMLTSFEREIPGVKAILNLISERIYHIHKSVTKLSDDTQPIPINIIEDIQKLSEEFKHPSNGGDMLMSTTLV